MRTEKQIRQDKLIAQSLFKHEAGHLSGTSERENCGACALEGYLSRSARADLKSQGMHHPIINYSGWLRVYIQAGRFIPSKFRKALEEELKSDNKLYLNATKEDIKIYGIAGSEEIKEILNKWVNENGI